jgi:large subunit ribosomal protein L3
VKTILGEKLGMTQIFDDDAQAIPVTIIKAGPVRVTQIKRAATDGYDAIQIAFKEMASKHVNRATAGHFARSDTPPAKHIVEVRVDDPDVFQLGQEIGIGDVLAEGQKADVTGISKGKGFAGVMKRHNFAGQGAGHGVHKVHRAPGAIGACATPARVFKGKRMPGRMGGDQVTLLNLEVVKVDAERNVVMVRGAVPGPKGAVLVMRQAVKING